MCLKEEERLFMLSLVKIAKPKTDLDKRILKRMVVRMMGYPLHSALPLYPERECPICEREFAGHVYERHYLICKSKEAAIKRLPPIDPVVYEMMGDYRR